MAISQKIRAFCTRFSKEPPIRLLARVAVKYGPAKLRTKALWDAVARPHYLVGVLQAADQAISEGRREISVLEFGVAAGSGLLALEAYAAAVERETGITIQVFGFDTGAGLPETSGDYRDHPDWWRPGDYPMDMDGLRSRLAERTKLILGNVRDTVPQFLAEPGIAPVGFVAYDMDLYSSTRDALAILSAPGRRMLRRVVLYLDDVDLFHNHQFAGELLAIHEFNRNCETVKIDRWHGLKKFRPFPDNIWVEKMYVAHDLQAISAVHLTRDRRVMT